MCSWVDYTDISALTCRHPTISFVSTFLVNLEAARWPAVFYVVMVAYFNFYGLHHLVHSAPEEKCEAIARAETELS
jgi:hypothetical protein